MIKVIHLVNDEKITKNIITYFENSDKVENLFILFKCTDEGLNKYDDSCVFNSKDLLFRDFIVDYDAVYIHFLDIHKVRFIKKNFTIIKNVHWFIWGGDIYNRPEIGNSIFSNRTVSTLLKIRFVKEFVRIITNKVRGSLFSMGEIKEFVRNNVDKLVTTIEEDAQLVNRVFKTNIKFGEFIYYTVGNDLKDIDLKKEGAFNILLGNSGHPTNNHIDVLEALSLKKEEFEKVIVPLNYGDKLYIKKVVEVGNRLLGKQFVPLLKFMALEEYNRILDSCDIAIFNNYRQQGFGNVVSLLSLGKTIYLSEKNTIYSYLLRNGVEVRKLDIDSFSLKRIEHQELKKNREIVFKLFSNINVINMQKKLYNGK
ncbi:TDP-N-acetylfucosamine:lipid II N-acetylfucosaminyltransferase [Myroides odoratimimus]|uniref:TDP-N-acetylfucosamine:lipid II N-acetylfucosaminyltransferase n=1 Tax=Myroides odoratimimus TaxID=76832 RepID=UPI0025789411|nr:TDP-N-acetylfucosamine:lipid II N-acetylfucosaminyltransferase [Myroides odoratimimus]MDM1527398.1 TDP-N-acetylfucosamine:lipid II N-acetylfucosaminyltransferase [Myroides odoratimimus]